LWTDKNRAKHDRDHLRYPRSLRLNATAVWLLANLFGQFPFLAKLFADTAYAGPIFDTALHKVLPNLKAEIVRRSDCAKGFVPYQSVGSSSVPSLG
jgi:hypothetical protein